MAENSSSTPQLLFVSPKCSSIMQSECLLPRLPASVCVGVLVFRVAQGTPALEVANCAEATALQLEDPGDACFVAIAFTVDMQTQPVVSPSPSKLIGDVVKQWWRIARPPLLFRAGLLLSAKPLPHPVLPSFIPRGDLCLWSSSARVLQQQLGYGEAGVLVLGGGLFEPLWPPCGRLRLPVLCLNFALYLLVLVCIEKGRQDAVSCPPPPHVQALQPPLAVVRHAGSWGSSTLIWRATFCPLLSSVDVPVFRILAGKPS